MVDIESGEFEVSEAEPAKPAEPAAGTRKRRRSAVLAPLQPVRWALRAVAAVGVYLLVLALVMPEALTGLWDKRAALYVPTYADIVAFLWPEQAPPAPPLTWANGARPGDVLAVKGVQVAYWGKPDAPYGEKVTRAAKKPVAIVVHFTDETPAATLVEYGHRADPTRGNGSFGYHFYIDTAGRVLQGAPLGVRTNHIKPAHASERTGGLNHLDGANTIGVSLIGACRSPRLAPITYRCAAETITTAQLESGLAIITALQERFAMPCAAVYGHGELQNDRKSFEGLTLSERARRRCQIGRS